MADPKKPTADWTDQTLAERLWACVVMLKVHRLMTDNERKKVLKRFQALFPDVAEIGIDGKVKCFSDTHQPSDEK